MASRTTCKPLMSAIKRSRPICENATSISSRTSIRQISATATKREVNLEADKTDRPRWSYTPEEMKAPYPWKPTDPKKAWNCNSDPAILDRFYASFLGPGGESVLTEEIKWLAITHKSFDQGRRGFNDRLAFFGRRILTMQANLAMVHSASKPKPRNPPTDGRQPVTHPALEGLAKLEEVPLSDILSRARIANLATSTGMRDIIRWQPRLVDNLGSSGVEVVLNGCVYAIIGAISLQRGGEVAGEITREKILKPLGIL
ncbi:ribonuclease-III-like-domain-containing protein [Amylocarpus encephaloides]|uniref:Ribonuclease-III-like-domain-containing protein n=1 Tax=Amylocarpus encephaloides TaxID=45428 RepID=A0A9P7Y8N1_9HELO|nr:ribonuclease-III-like-domain-containing protein [Amylocarpus encephaloides]